MQTVTVKLPSNKTYPCRVATYIPITLDPETAAGVLEIRESRTQGGKSLVSRYAVRETDTDWGIGFRLTKPGGQSWYHVCINPDELDECECQGFDSQGVCKHTHVMRILILSGVLHPISE